MRSRATVLFGWMIVLAACGQADPGDLTGFETAEITIGGTDLLVAVADDLDERWQGLRQVSDLGDLEGMLFIWETPKPVNMTMEDTLISLDVIAWGADGREIARFSMEPCDHEICPLYPIEGHVRWLLEVPAGEGEKVLGEFEARGTG